MSTKTSWFLQEMTEKIAFEVGNPTSKIYENLGENIGIKIICFDTLHVSNSCLQSSW